MKRENNTYKVWIVGDEKMGFLREPTYTGRRPAAWVPIGEAHTFPSIAAAQACASNIARRGASGIPSVSEVEMFRRS